MATTNAPRDRASSAAPVAEDATQKEGAVLTADDLARLHDLSRALSGGCEHAEIAVIAAERARALTGASVTQVVERRGGRSLAVIAEATGAAATGPDDEIRFRGMRGLQRASIGSMGPEQHALRTGAPIWIRSRTEARQHCPDLALDALTGGPDGASWAFLPLVADGDTNGVLTLVFDAARAFDPHARTFLGEVAAACGDALARGSLFTQERARANASEEALAACGVRQRLSERRFADRTHLYERERFARARAEAETVVAVHAADDLERVQPLTAALFDAETAADVVAALVDHGPDAFGALDLELTRRDDAGGGRDEARARTAEAEVVRRGEPLWLDPKELALRCPETAAALLARGGGSWLGIPVPGEDRAHAVLSIAFPRERAFTPGDRTRLVLLANECASVLARCAARDADVAQVVREADAAKAPSAFVVQYEEDGVTGPVTRVLGVFSSETSAREALRELDRTRSLVCHAAITSWILDVARPLTSVEIDLPE
jgi:GAF domain-containing protein